MIPFHHSKIEQEEIDAVIETMKSGWLACGPKTKEFEEKFSEYIGCKYACMVNNCTSALFLALNAMCIDGEVITTPLTFPATSNTIIHNGGKPVFVDIDPKTYNIDANKIEDAITDRTTAILPVHFAGLPCDMDKIKKIAVDYDLAIIEDAAHAVGSEYKSVKIGNLSKDYSFPELHATCFSFYATKNMTSGVGGCITTNNRELNEKLRLLRNHGVHKDTWQRDSPFYNVVAHGYNMYMSDINASIGIEQLKKLDRMIEAKNRIAHEYDERLSKKIKKPFVPLDVVHSRHLYPILLPDSIKPKDFIFEMKLRKIECSYHYLDLPEQPAFRTKKEFPIAKDYSAREVSLPIYPDLTKEQVDYIIQKTNEVVG